MASESVVGSIIAGIVLKYYNNVQVWDADIQRHENSIKQILLVAQGELALEEFLKQVR